MTPDPEFHPEFYESVPTKRFLAWIIDTILILLLCFIALPFTVFTALFFFPLLYVAVGVVYRWATLASGSATFGMRVMSIEIRDAEDRRLSGGVALMHTLGYTLSIGTFFVQVISMILMISSLRGQGITDMALGTVALNARR
ncbi:MAG: RDD family protein [Pseudomonadota bacterium]